MADRVCEGCGGLFQPKRSDSRFCGRMKEVICPICGKVFTTKCSSDQNKKTCSKECASKSAVKSVKLPPKTCEYCGEEFVPTNPAQRYCKKIHYRRCKICGKDFILDTTKCQSDWPTTCSIECRNIAISANNGMKQDEGKQKFRDSCLAKYGVDHPMRVQEIKNKCVQTNLDNHGGTHFNCTEGYRERAEKTNSIRYGCSWPMQSSEIQEKAKCTTLSNFGVSNPSQSSDILCKIQQTNRLKYGTDWAISSPEVIQKSRETCVERYGAEYYQYTDEFKERFKETSLQRYGVSSPTKSKQIQDKIRQTNIERYGAVRCMCLPEYQKRMKQTNNRLYGVDCFTQTREYAHSQMTDPAKVDKWMEFKSDPISFITDNFDPLPTVSQIADLCGVSDTTVWVHVYSSNAGNLVSKYKSSMETEVIEYIQSVRPDVSIQVHDRDVIRPLELDIFIPELNIAFECNPTFTHNSSLGDCWGGPPKSYKYHQIKTNMCEDEGVFLFHIFGYEWLHKRKIIESMISNLLHVSSNKIFARKCRVVEVTSKQCRDFLDTNHRQGFTSSQIKLGLVYEDELVSLMTFSRPRHTIGQKDTSTNTYELSRFCSKLNYNVVGAASKLLKHFVNKYEPNKIVSYSDRSHTKGNLYVCLGFKEVRRSDPNYVWVDTNTDISYHRMNAQKSNIQKFLDEPDLDLNKPESQLMIAHGYVQVFDSGTITWKWVGK